MGDFITSQDYPAIRSALDLSIDTEVIPDSVIEQATNLAAAEQEIKERDPSWQTRPAVGQSHLKNAAVYLVAARIAPSIPDITREKRGQNQEYQREAVDWLARAAWLKGEATREISAARAGGVRPTRKFTIFGRASGGRGG
jgi:hypothetical protein